MDGTVLFGLLKVVAISLVPVGIVAAFLHARFLAQHVVALGRRVHLLAPAPDPPLGPPLEKIAADLRRLRPEVHSPRPGIAMARQRGIVAAYDGVLVRAATALGVTTTLTEVPEGLDREAERLRVEHALELAGLSWRVNRS
jgi:hypothetical protein